MRKRDLKALIGQIEKQIHEMDEYHAHHRGIHLRNLQKHRNELARRQDNRVFDPQTHSSLTERLKDAQIDMQMAINSCVDKPWDQTQLEALLSNVVTAALRVHTPPSNHRMAIAPGEEVF